MSIAGGALGLAIGQTCWSVFGGLVPAQVGGKRLSVQLAHGVVHGDNLDSAGVLFGCAPALRAAAVPLQETLKEGGRTGESRAGLRLRDGLVWDILRWRLRCWWVPA